jgi:hypothetical protein
MMLQGTSHRAIKVDAATGVDWRTSFLATTSAQERVENKFLLQSIKPKVADTLAELRGVL